MTYESDRCIRYGIYPSRFGSLLPVFCSWSAALRTGALLFLTRSAMYSSLAGIQAPLCQMAHSRVKQCLILTLHYI